MPEEDVTRRRHVLLVDVTQAASEVSRLVHQARDLNLPVEPGVRDGRDALVRWAVLLDELIPKPATTTQLVPVPAGAAESLVRSRLEPAKKSPLSFRQQGERGIQLLRSVAAVACWHFRAGSRPRDRALSPGARSGPTTPGRLPGPGVVVRSDVDAVADGAGQGGPIGGDGSIMIAWPRSTTTNSRPCGGCGPPSASSRSSRSSATTQAMTRQRRRMRQCRRQRWPTRGGCLLRSASKPTRSSPGR